MKLLLYSHNVYGLGHVARSTRIARAAVERGIACTLMTGCPALDSLALDPRVRVERLPAARVGDDLRLRARDPKLAGEDIIAIRSALILQTIERLEPDAVLVDHLPLGLGGELCPSLLAAARDRPRFIWGMPYNEGSVSSAGPPGNPRLRRAHARYDCALAYGDPRYDDSLARVPSWLLPPRHEYVGFVTRELPAITTPARPRIVCLVGGGHGAAKVFAGVLAGFRALKRRSEAGSRLRLVAGPLGSSPALDELVGEDPDVELWPTGTVEQAIADASIVVSGVGYNTAFTLARSSLPVIFLPQGNADQLRRAELLGQLPGIEVLDERAPDFVDTLASSLAAGLAAGPGVRDFPFIVDGAERAAAAIASLLDERPTRG